MSAKQRKAIASRGRAEPSLPDEEGLSAEEFLQRAEDRAGPFFLDRVLELLGLPRGENFDMRAAQAQARINAKEVGESAAWRRLQQMAAQVGQLQAAPAAAKRAAQRAAGALAQIAEALIQLMERLSGDPRTLVAALLLELGLPLCRDTASATAVFNSQAQPPVVLTALRILTAALSGAPATKVQLLRVFRANLQVLREFIDFEAENVAEAPLATALLLRLAGSEPVESRGLASEIWRGVCAEALSPRLKAFISAQEAVLFSLASADTGDSEATFELLLALQAQGLISDRLAGLLAQLALAPVAKVSSVALRFLIHAHGLADQHARYEEDKMTPFALLMWRAASTRPPAMSAGADIAARLARLWDISEWAQPLLAHLTNLCRNMRSPQPGLPLMLLLFLVHFEGPLPALRGALTGSLRELLALFSSADEAQALVLDLLRRQAAFDDHGDELAPVLRVLHDLLSHTSSPCVIRATSDFYKAHLRLRAVREEIARQYQTLKAGCAQWPDGAEPDGRLVLALQRLQFVSEHSTREIGMMDDFPLVERLLRAYLTGIFEFEAAAAVRACLRVVFNAYVAVYLSYFRAKDDLEGYRQRNADTRVRLIAVLEDFLHYSNNRFGVSTTASAAIRAHAFGLLCALYALISADVVQRALFVFYPPSADNCAALAGFFRAQLLQQPDATAGGGPAAEAARTLCRQFLEVVEKCSLAMGRQIASDVLLLCHHSREAAAALSDTVEAFLAKMIARDCAEKNFTGWTFLRQCFGHAAAQPAALEALAASWARALGRFSSKKPESEEKSLAFGHAFLNALCLLFNQATARPETLPWLRALKAFIRKEIMRGKDDAMRRLLLRAKTLHGQLGLDDRYSEGLGALAEFVVALERLLDLNARVPPPLEEGPQSNSSAVARTPAPRKPRGLSKSLLLRQSEGARPLMETHVPKKSRRSAKSPAKDK